MTACITALNVAEKEREVMSSLASLLVRALLSICSQTAEVLRSVDAPINVERCWLIRLVKIASLVASEDPCLRLYSLLPRVVIEEVLEQARLGTLRLLEIEENGINAVTLNLDESPLV